MPVSLAQPTDERQQRCRRPFEELLLGGYLPRVVVEQDFPHVSRAELFRRHAQVVPGVLKKAADREAGVLTHRFGQCVTGRRGQELVDEIVELGKRYGIVTPYTSFLVTEDELVHAPDVISEKQALTAPTGRGAFRAAETLGKMKRDVLVFSEGEEALSIRIIGEKVFYLEESVWVDSEYTEDTDEKVLILWSDEFIDFLREHPEVGRYLSLGDEVIFVYGKVAYRVRS